MALFAPRVVLRGFSAAAYLMYASPQTLVRPCATQKLLISGLDTNYRLESVIGYRGGSNNLVQFYSFFLKSILQSA
jgi:hypothetical protein